MGHRVYLCLNVTEDKDASTYIVKNYKGLFMKNS